MKTPKIVGRECLEAGKHSQESQRGLTIGKGNTGHNSTKNDLHELHLLQENSYATEFYAATA